MSSHRKDYDCTWPVHFLMDQCVSARRSRECKWQDAIVVQLHPEAPPPGVEGPYRSTVEVIFQDKSRMFIHPDMSNDCLRPHTNVVGGRGPPKWVIDWHAKRHEQLNTRPRRSDPCPQSSASSGPSAPARASPERERPAQPKSGWRVPFFLGGEERRLLKRQRLAIADVPEID